MARIIEITLGNDAPKHPTRFYTSRRYRLGYRLHPAQITDAWYESGCPPSGQFRPSDRGISLPTIIRWRIACWLRKTG